MNDAPYKTRQYFTGEETACDKCGKDGYLHGWTIGNRRYIFCAVHNQEVIDLINKAVETYIEPPAEKVKF